MRAAAVVSLTLGLFPLLFAARADDASDAARAALHARIDEQHLADDPGWRTLLHLVPGEQRSPVVDAWFFFDAHGRDDARAELHATLDALIDDRRVPLREESARCVFGARAAFLSRRLGADFDARVPAGPCDRRDAWFASLDAQQVWLVFPSGYLNSPSSMFGHTLLRVDSTDSQQRGPLLAYAINFAAETGESNGLVFAVKGLGGGYQGRYSVLPYYEKVREYARLESRDLWEYRLRLDDDERRRLLLHVWELRGAGFTYFFFTRNCAYQVLALLQTVRPEHDLLSSLQGWAIPTDTLRELQEDGWIDEVHFRPALNTALRAHADDLPPPAREVAADLGHGRDGPDDPRLAALPPVQQARALDVAHDLVYSRYQSGGNRDALLAQSKTLLAARAATGQRSDWPAVPEPTAAPDAGHRTQRLIAGAWATDHGGGPTLGYRGAYHDLLDDPAGYTEGSQIEFVDAALRYDLTRTRAQIDHVAVLDIVSLGRRDDLLAPISWRVSTGLRRDLDGDSPLRGYLDGGPGLSFGRPAWLGYAFAPVALEVGEGFDRGGYAVGGGLAAGTLAQFAPDLRGKLEASWRWRLAGAHREVRRIGTQLQWDCTRDWALRADAAGEDLRNGRGLQPGGSISLLRYF